MFRQIRRTGRLAKAHHVLVNTIIKHLFYKHVNAIVGRRAIAQLANVHAWAQAYMLPPIEAFNTVFVILI